LAGPRAQWKGFLKVDELSCAVALYTAASTAERTSFHLLNKKTGNRLKREFVDEKSGKPVDKEDQVKGYETDNGEYIVLEQDEIDAVIPQSDKTLAVQTFIPADEIETLYFDKPYYLAPADDVARKAFNLIRDGMRDRNVGALAGAVLFRRARTLLVRPYEEGMIANTLSFDYEVRSVEDAFRNIKPVKVKREMLDLAAHIIDTMSGEFNPKDFHDEYEAALTELVRAKIEGREISIVKPKREEKVVDLMEALRQSAKATARKKPAAKAGGERRKSAA
jgi:DNA end-binding protein Ku